MRFALLIVLSALTSASAWALPSHFNHQGRLLDSAGVPLDGSHSLSLALHDSPAGGSEVWTGTKAVNFTNGYYNVQLGDVSAIDSAAIDLDALYLSIGVDGGPDLPDRVQIAAVPYATHASNVSGGVVDASEVRINGTTVIDGSGLQLASEWSALSNVPAGFADDIDNDAIGALTGCTDGQVAVFSSGSWTCADNEIAASAITSGTLDITRLPTGTSATTVAVGNHTHSEYVAAGSAGGACNSGTAGQFYYDDGLGSFFGCDGSEWVAFSTAPAAQTDCAAVLADDSGASSGEYWIDPTGNDPYQAYCNMDDHGGGWTQIMNLDTNDGANRHYFDEFFWTAPLTSGSLGNHDTADFKSQAFWDLPATSLLIVAHDEGTVLGTAYYNLVAPAAGETMRHNFESLANTTITGSRVANTGSVGNGGRARNAGDAFIDQSHPIIINSRYSPLDSDNYTRIGTNYADQCGIINCNGHNYGGLGGRHYRSGWGTSYEGAALNGYCSTQGGYGSNGVAYNGNDAFAGCSPSLVDVDFAIYVR